MSIMSKPNGNKQQNGNGSKEITKVDEQPSGLAIPDDVMSLFPKMEETAPLQREFFSSPYVQFMDTRSAKYADVVQKLGGTPPGTPVLILPTGDMYRLDNMQFWLTPFRFQHWSVINDKNELLQSAVNVDQVPSDGKRWNEFIESIAIVMTHDGPMPTRIGWKTTKCNAAHDVYKALDDVVNAPQKFASISVDHAAAMQAIPLPWLRAYGIIQLKAGKGDYDYIAANAMVKATSAGQYAAIAQMLANADTKRILQTCIEGHNERITEVKKKCI